MLAVVMYVICAKSVCEWSGDESDGDSDGDDGLVPVFPTNCFLPFVELRALDKSRLPFSTREQRILDPSHNFPPN